MSSTLPAGFEALEPFVDAWATDSSTRRAELRGEVDAAHRKAFYEAAQPLTEQALDYLDSKPLADHDASEKRLMQLMLSLAHVALAEEVHLDMEERHAQFRAFMPVTRAPSDF
jgi:hypothetical protein